MAGKRRVLGVTLMGVGLMVHGAVAQQTLPAANGLLPPFFLKSVPGDAALRAPLATAEDEQGFLVAYGNLLVDATKGTRDDRSAAAEVLRKKSEEAGSSAGMKRLLLVHAFDLASRGGLPLKEIEPYAGRAFAALSGDSIALAERRVGLMEVMAGLASYEPRDSVTSIADAYFELAELYAHAGMAYQALWAMDNGEAWVVDETAYLAKVRPRVEALRAAVGKGKL